MRRRQSVKVVFLTRYDRSRASSRVRVYDYLPHLQRMGFQCQVLPFPPKLTSVTKMRYLFQALWFAGWADVVVFQKLVIRKVFVDLLRRVNPRIVFDFDDALWTPPDAFSHDPQVRALYQVQVRYLHHILTQARCVIAGNYYLARYAMQFASSVHVIPSSVDLERYPLKVTWSDEEKVVFGWIGSPENLVDFKSAQEGLRRFFLQFGAKAMLKIVSTSPLSLDGAPVQFERWELDRDVDFLHSFDVGLMPLNDTERSRGRCGFKAIQYMAVGLPVIASPIGAATEIVEHERTGFLASTAEEWEEALMRLASDKDLRMRLGRAGREKVERLFSIQGNAPKLATILREVASS